MNWKTEYTYEDRAVEMLLFVRCPNGDKWFWGAQDNHIDYEYNGCISVLPGVATKEEAMQAAENWYAKWLANFVATGSRDID